MTTVGPDGAWAAALRRLRETERLSRDQLADAAGVAASTLKAYELGTRRPSRESLTALLSALKADVYTRGEILAGAGFAPDGQSPSARRADEWFSLLDAVDENAASPFPVCLSTEVMEVVGANVLIQRIWELDLNRELKGPYEHSLLSMLTRSRVGRKLVNWEECISLPISVVKGHYGGDAAMLGQANPYFASAIEHLMQGEPDLVARFLRIWTTVPPRRRKLRFAYPVVWQHSELGVMRFHVSANPADEQGAIVFNDWVPRDAETWEKVETLRARRDARYDFVGGVGPESG